MVQRLYVVYDRVAQESGPIFTAVNDGVALRNVRGLLKDVVPYDRPSYRLMYLGEYDTSTMTIDSEVPREIVLEFRDMTEEEIKDATAR